MISSKSELERTETQFRAPPIFVRSVQGLRFIAKIVGMFLRRPGAVTSSSACDALIVYKNIAGLVTYFTHYTRRCSACKKL